MFYTTNPIIQPMVHTILSNDSPRARPQVTSSEIKEQVHAKPIETNCKQ
jgi:hypothetical protein